jgi:hypothetical protein
MLMRKVRKGTVPFVRVLDKEEEPKKSERDFNQYIGG